MAGGGFGERELRILLHASTNAPLDENDFGWTVADDLRFDYEPHGGNSPSLRLPVTSAARLRWSQSRGTWQATRKSLIYRAVNYIPSRSVARFLGVGETEWYFPVSLTPAVVAGG